MLALALSDDTGEALLRPLSPDIIDFDNCAREVGEQVPLQYYYAPRPSLSEPCVMSFTNAVSTGTVLSLRVLLRFALSS